MGFGLSPLHFKGRGGICTFMHAFLFSVVWSSATELPSQPHTSLSFVVTGHAVSCWKHLSLPTPFAFLLLCSMRTCWVFPTYRYQAKYLTHYTLFKTSRGGKDCSILDANSEVYAAQAS